MSLTADCKCQEERYLIADVEREKRQPIENLWTIKLINREESENEAEKIKEIFLNFLKKIIIGFQEAQSTAR